MTPRLPRATAVVLLLAVSACSPTTYDASAGTTEAPATSSTLPTGTLEELLPLMQAEVDALPALVAAGKGDGTAATRIEQYWASIRPEVLAGWPELVTDFEFVVRLCRTAADRNRPANADRASKNMEALVSAVLAG